MMPIAFFRGVVKKKETVAGERPPPGSTEGKGEKKTLCAPQVRKFRRCFLNCVQKKFCAVSICTEGRIPASQKKRPKRCGTLFQGLEAMVYT
jgi:hypothetical protein